MNDSDFFYEEDANSSIGNLPSEYQDFFWEIQDWSDESNEFYHSIEYSNSNLHFSIQRDNTQQFKIDVCGYNKKEGTERFQIRLTLLNQINHLDLSKTFDISASSKYEDPQEIIFPIKQSEVSQNGYTVKDQIRIQIQIKTKITDDFYSQDENNDSFLIENDSIFKQLPNSPIKRDKTVIYTGLKNQGATCYMNSLLQSLFHLPIFRKIVFEMEEKSDIPTPTNIVHNLKLLFAQMQFQMNQPLDIQRKSVSTTSLTTSFGWTYENTFTQHDVQEFCRVLLDKLEEKMKETKYEDSIKKIFCGEFQTITKGIDFDFKNKINNEFYDLSLEVKNCEDIYQSFDKYVEDQILNGENQYDSEKFGKQDALMGIKFIRFPRVLHLHLKRFEIDQENNRGIKINSPFKFYKTIDLSKYLIENESNEIEIIEVDESESESENEKEKENNHLISNKNESKSAVFDLFGVLVHSGSSSSGHFYAFLRPNLGGKWFQFNDSLVTEAREEEAIENNFGKEGGTFSAYMLIYTKRSEQKNLFQTVDDDSIPPEIVEEYFQLIEKEKEDEKNQFNYKIEINDSINIFLYTEKTTLIPNSMKNKLSFSFKKDKSLSFSLKKSNTNNDLYSKVSELYSIPIEKVDLWKFSESELNSIIRKDNDSLSQLFLNNVNVFVFINNYEKEKNDKSEDDQHSIENKEIQVLFSPTTSVVFPHDFDDDLSYELEMSQNNDDDDDAFSFLNQTEIPVFVFAYRPFSSPFFVFLFSIKTDKSEHIIEFISSKTKSIFEIENEGNDQEFNVYHLKNEKLNRIKSEDDTFNSNNCDSGEIFVIEYKREDFDDFYIELIQRAIEKNGYSKEKVDEEKDDEDEVIELKLNEEDESDKKAVNFLDIMSVENINASKYYSFLNDYNLIEVCSVIETKKVKYPNSIQFGEFCQFLCAVFNNGSFVILFRENQIRMINEDEKKVMSSVISPHEKKITAMFLDGSIVNDQNEIEINGTFVPFENIIRFVVDISFDGISKSMSTEILIPDFFYVSEIFNIVKEKGLIENFQIEKTRILELNKGRIISTLKLNEPILFLSEQIRIEKVPDDQIDIENHDLIKISFSIEIKHDPFLFLLKEEFSTLFDVKEEIRKLINEPESVFSSYELKFFDENSKEINESIKDQTKIKEVEPKILEILFIKQPKLSIFHENIDRSVHIFN